MARFTTIGGSGEGTPGPQGPAGADGADGADGAPGADGADGQYPNYLGEYNNGASYPIGAIVSIPVGSPYGNPGQLFIRATNPGNPGYPPGTDSWTEYTNGLIVAGLSAYLPLKAFQEASDYSVDYGYFSHATYGNSIAIARTPQVDAYINYAISKGVPQSWTFKSFGSDESFTLTLGVPVPNVENTAPNKEIWVLEYNSTAYNAIASGITDENEYGLYLTDTGAIAGNSYDKLYVTHNGDGQNVKIGDDAWIGDVNEANHISIQGNQDSSKGGIVFGDNETEKIASDGSNLTIEADNDIILYPGSSYAYLGTPTVGGETRIATRGYVDAIGTTTSSYTPSWTGTGLAYTGTPAVGSYVRIGDLVSFNIKVTLTNVTNFGTGQYSLTLPFAPISDYIFRDGGFHDTSTGNHHAISADAEDGTVQMTLWHPGSSARDIAFDHNTPITLTTANYFYVSGTYIAAE